MMTPRLASSKKWTSIPAELCEQIRDVFAENFVELAKSGQFLVDGRIYTQELLLQVGFLPKGRLRQVNFEVSINFDVNKQNALELIHFIVDCAASLLQEYFVAGENIESFPIQWKSYELEGRNIFVQVSTTNTALESEANRLLGMTTDDLVREDPLDSNIAGETDSDENTDSDDTDSSDEEPIH